MTVSANITAGHSNAFLVINAGLTTDYSTLSKIQYLCSIYVNDVAVENFYDEESDGTIYGNYAPLTMSKTIAMDLGTYGLTNQALNLQVVCQRHLPGGYNASPTVNVTFFAQIVGR